MRMVVAKDAGGVGAGDAIAVVDGSGKIVFMRVAAVERRGNGDRSSLVRVDRPPAAPDQLTPDHQLEFEIHPSEQILVAGPWGGPA